MKIMKTLKNGKIILTRKNGFPSLNGRMIVNYDGVLMIATNGGWANVSTDETTYNAIANWLVDTVPKTKISDSNTKNETDWDNLQNEGASDGYNPFR